MKYNLIGIVLILLRNVITAEVGNNVLGYFISNVLKTSHTVTFECDLNDIKTISGNLLGHYNFVERININKTFHLSLVLTHKAYAKTSVILDCRCEHIKTLLLNISEFRLFNKTYSWLLLDEDDICRDHLHHSHLKYLGPNSQIIIVKRNNTEWKFFDIHSKGRHLQAPLEIVLMAEFVGSQKSNNVVFKEVIPLFHVQGIKYRDNFNSLTLRGASVIDQDNITSNAQINDILQRPAKDIGVAAFSKFYFGLSVILRERLNFAIDFRNARGWAGKIENSTYRLGYVGIMQRNEADIGASASYSRINRFPYLDILYEGWMFETSFLYRFTPDLNTQNKKGNFFAPFAIHVWIITIITFFVLILVWIWIENTKITISNKKNTSTRIYKDNIYIVPLHIFAALCQQGLDPITKGFSSRIIIITTFIFALLIYNYYTSSLVGGLLSNTAKGPTSVEEITASKLRVSFEDIGYYKILFRENKTPRTVALLNKKVLPPRDLKDLPVYTHLEEAIPYLKRGGYAFHCEIVDAYPEIAKQFDTTEICDLRVVSGLLESELVNYVLTKNSQYTELFRVILIRARETGIIKRLLRERQPSKPVCEAMYTVYPVHFSGTTDAFILLAGGIFASLLALSIEIYFKFYFNRIQPGIQSSRLGFLLNFHTLFNKPAKT